MVALLLVRSLTDIPFAIRAVNEFLACRRSGPEPAQDDEILAVCLKGDLDAGFPIWHWLGHEPRCTNVRVRASSGNVPAGAGLGIWESFSLSGIWTFCRVDGPRLRSAPNAEARRQAILRMLVDTPSRLGSSAEPEAVFPVFGPDVPAESVATEVHALKARYPRLIGASWYRDDKMRGIVNA